MKDIAIVDPYPRTMELIFSKPKLIELKNNRNINSALQILEFDGKKFNYVGVFKNDSLDTSKNLNF